MRGMIVLVLVMSLAGASGLAARSEEAIFPEFLAGTLGGYVGAFLGANTLSWALSSGATGWDALSRAILGAYVGFAAGAVVGSALGVIGTAALLGVEGNVGLCLLGAAAGTGGILIFGFSLQIPEAVLPVGPAIAAVCATAGFNVRARSRQPATEGP